MKKKVRKNRRSFYRNKYNLENMRIKLNSEMLYKNKNWSLTTDKQIDGKNTYENSTNQCFAYKQDNRNYKQIKKLLQKIKRLIHIFSPCIIF